VVPVWLLFYHDLIGIVILLCLSYWAITQRDRVNKRFSDMRAELDEAEDRLGQVREENSKLRQQNGRLKTEHRALSERLRGQTVTQAELDMLEKFKRDGLARPGLASQITITAQGDVTIGGDVAGRDQMSAGQEADG